MAKIIYEKPRKARIIEKEGVRYEGVLYEYGATVEIVAEKTDDEYCQSPYSYELYKYQSGYKPDYFFFIHWSEVLYGRIGGNFALGMNLFTSSFGTFF